MSIYSPNEKFSIGILQKDAYVVLIKTEWNATIVNQLESGCVNVLNENKVQHNTLTVPGAFEISFAIKKYWDSCLKKNQPLPAEFIALGCVIQWGPPHFDYVCKATTEGIIQINLLLPFPVIYGIFTVNNEQQALERLGGPHGHKGEEAGWTAIKMIRFCENFQTHS